MYFFLLIQSIAFGIESIYCKISDLSKPSEEDYRILKVLQYNISFKDSKDIETIAAGVIGFDFTIFDNWNTAAFDLQWLFFIQTGTKRTACGSFI